jgi:hypothetical protein
VELRIGVNTGEVMVPVDRPIDLGGLHGDTLNVASRLQTAAESGTILVADRSVRASRSFQFEDKGMISVRGRLEPVHGFELIGAQAVPQRATPLIRAPLIGRDAELAALNDAWQSAVRTRRAALVTVVGEAGVGKSRLVSEFVDRVSSDAQMMKGRCLPFGEELAFRPLADLWRQRIGVLETDAPEVVREKTAEYVGELLENARFRAEAEIGLAHTLDVADTGSQADVPPRVVARRIRVAWHLVLEALAAVHPVLIVLEDLHWADSSLLELVDGLAASVEDGVLFLCTTRPSLFEDVPDASIGARLEIGPLAIGDAGSLFDALVEGSETALSLRRDVLAKAEGNPLFLEEILRHLVDEGALVRSGEGWRVERGMRELRLPDTIQAVLASRIDLLAAEEKSALQTAAVVGREFWLEAVATLLEQPPAGVEVLLDRLEERDLIRLRQAGREIERSYVFNHVLTRDVAYASLPRRSRSVLHDRLVGWLEEAAGISRPDLLAHHAVRSFEEAGHVLSLNPDDQERLRKRALAALLQASAASRTGNSIDTARTHARRAALLVAEPAEKARVQEALGEAAYFNYEGDDAWRHLQQAITLLDSSGTSTPRELARLSCRALETPLRRPGIMVHHPAEQEVFEDLGQALEWAGDGDSAERARLLMLKSFWRHAYPATNDHEPLVSDREALEAGELAAEIARRVGRPDIESAALDGVSANHIPDSNYAEAWKATHRRLTLVDDIQDPEEIGDIHAMQCWVDFHRGHYRQVREFGDIGFRHTIDQVPSVALHCLAWRGVSRFRLGDWDGVLDDYSIGLEILGEARPEPPYFASGLWAVAAVVNELRGHRDAADEIMETLASSQPTESGSDPAPLAPWVEFLGPVLARRGQADLALRLIDSSSFRRGTRRGLLHQAQCDTMLDGARWDRAGEVAAATRQFGEARGLEALAPAANRLEGVAFVTAGRFEDGIGLLHRARDAFAGLDARYDVALTEIRLADALLMVDRADPEMSSRAIAELRRLGVVDLPTLASA